MPPPPARVTRPGSPGPWVGLPLPSPTRCSRDCSRDSDGGGGCRGHQRGSRPVTSWPLDAPGGAAARAVRQQPAPARSSPTRPGSSRRSGPGPPPSRATAGTRERRARDRRERPLAHPLVGEPRAAPNLAVAPARPRHTMRRPTLLESEAVLPAPVALHLPDASALRRQRSEPSGRSEFVIARRDGSRPPDTTRPEAPGVQSTRSPQDRPSPSSRIGTSSHGTHLD
jgi:hypothetical protein